MSARYRVWIEETRTIEIDVRAGTRQGAERLALAHANRQAADDAPAATTSIHPVRRTPRMVVRLTGGIAQP
ncbi:hypothetical protein DY218_27435 [Streptomyces triticagri]|uniref:Uncharacterized protein n=1 Tax=Streptomyces triticagri TaxID=2293568 RepID=A0A372LZE9_9ACTN|nr:hypothetical protein [Streptomyces triticagri]RFU83643.1 hypothetical protein DY218_27435 [Streptomyces triticagri]